MLLDGILSYEVLINVALGCPRILKLLHLLNSRGGEKANKWMDRFLQYFCLDFRFRAKIYWICRSGNCMQWIVN